MAPDYLAFRDSELRRFGAADHLCSSQDTEQVTHRCRDCSAEMQDLCAMCAMEHSKNPVTAVHNVILIADIDMAMVDVRVSCHNNTTHVATVYCGQCHFLLCDACLAAQHATCEQHEPMARVAARLREGQFASAVEVLGRTKEVAIHILRSIERDSQRVSGAPVMADATVRVVTCETVRARHVARRIRSLGRAHDYLVAFHQLAGDAEVIHMAPFVRVSTTCLTNLALFGGQKRAEAGEVMRGTDACMTLQHASEVQVDEDWF